MAARPTWKGFLKISLVNIPIKVFPATESGGTISFNQLHGACQTRIQQKQWCPRCDREVPASELVKGYEFEKGRYVVLTEDDFDKVRPASTRVIDLVQFADRSAIDPTYVDRTYYLAPDGTLAGEAFAVMREGLEGKVGIGKLALYGREYLVAVSSHGRGIVMHTLHHTAELRSVDTVEELNSIPVKVKPDEVKLARQVIATFDAPLEPRRIPRAAPADHRREGRRGRDRCSERRRTPTRGEPDGRPSEEPERGQRGKEEAGESIGRQAGCEA